VDPRGYYGGVTTTLSQPSARKLAIKVPILLLLFFILATGIGVAHQFFYSFLNGRLAKNQAVSSSLVLGLTTPFAFGCNSSYL